MELLLFVSLAAASTFVYAFAGFGGALLIVPILATFMDLQLALPALTLAGFAMNALLLAETREHVQWKVVGMMFIGAAVGTPLGVLGLKNLPQQWTGLTVSVLAALTGIIFLLRLRVTLGPSLAPRLLTGVLAGLLAGGTATPGPPVVIYALARAWPKDRFRANLIFFFTGLGAYTLLNFVLQGMMTGASFKYGFIAMVPMMIASAFGVKAKQRVSESRFRLVVLWLLILTGAIGCVRALVG